jgi:hypothetical protein
MARTGKTAASVAMGKKKAVGRPRAATKRGPIVNLKGVPEFKTWLDGFAEHCGLSIADTIGQALLHYAEYRGFRSPPKR